MDQSNRLFRTIGMMSGSSLDGVDVVDCSFSFAEEGHLLSWSLLHAETIPLSQEWLDRLPLLEQGTYQELTIADVEFGDYLGEIASSLMRQWGGPYNFICSHGHTIFHEPELGYSTQIGHGTTMSSRTGHTVINQFRLMDIAHGGQGAPIAPIADEWLLSDHHYCLNLGGIANISGKSTNGRVAFDISGANQILNRLAQEIGLPFDHDGHLASQGKVIQPLLADQLNLPFFKKPFPKSLSNQWVTIHQTTPFLNAPYDIKDKLATACRLIAIQIKDAIQLIRHHTTDHHDPTETLLITGGGAFNKFLIRQIQQALVDHQLNVRVVIPEPEIINFKEAIMIGLMGALCWQKIPNCMATVTGARKDVIGGIIHQSVAP